MLVNTAFVCKYVIGYCIPDLLISIIRAEFHPALGQKESNQRSVIPLSFFLF